MAEDYIAKRYAEIGLAPAGEHGTYFQTVPLREATLTSGSFVAHTKAGDVAFEQRHDIVVRPWTRAPEISLDAPLVFVGYGIDRADIGYDDLTGVDLQGGIAVIFGGAPRTLGGRRVDDALHAVMADVAARSRTLRDHGAAAVLVIYDPLRAKQLAWSKYTAAVPEQTMDWLEAGAVASDPVIPLFTTDLDGLDKLAGAPIAQVVWQQLDRGERPKVDLAATGSLRITSAIHDITARNVIGVLPGGDLVAEYVVYTAHHDHLGIGKPVNGDAIYNGAADNAIGVAEVLEMAHAFRALPHPPRRSILFVAVTAEERGLLGSEYFTTHPTVPIERIVADINIDGSVPIQIVLDMSCLGAEHSLLEASCRQAARAAGLIYSPDPAPEGVDFIRSDQYSFVKRGIPSVYVVGGNLDASGHTEANAAIGNKWLAAHYHQPSDEWLPEYRAELTLPEMRYQALLGLAVADADTRPTWNAGDVFGTVGKPAARRDSRQAVSPRVDGSAKQP